VCAIDGREKTVLGIDGIQLQILQICMDYHVLPDLEKITVGQIHFFYKARIKELCKLQKDL
jgi:hypothetical protein